MSMGLATDGNGESGRMGGMGKYLIPTDRKQGPLPICGPYRSEQATLVIHDEYAAYELSWCTHVGETLIYYKHRDGRSTQIVECARCHLQWYEG